jgi:hypothetical protein
VNVASDRVGGHQPERPKHQQNHCNCPEHVCLSAPRLLLPAGISIRPHSNCRATNRTRAILGTSISRVVARTTDSHQYESTSRSIRRTWDIPGVHRRNNSAPVPQRSLALGVGEIGLEGPRQPGVHNASSSRACPTRACIFASSQARDRPAPWPSGRSPGGPRATRLRTR